MRVVYLGIVLLLPVALVGCSPSISEAEAVAIAKQELQNRQPVPNVADLELTAKRGSNGHWQVEAMPGPKWTGPNDVAFPLTVEIDRRGNVVGRM